MKPKLTHCYIFYPVVQVFSGSPSGIKIALIISIVNIAVLLTLVDQIVNSFYVINFFQLVPITK